MSQTEEISEDSGWEDVLGSGQLLRKVVKSHENDTGDKPKRFDVVDIRLVERLSDGTVVSTLESLSFAIGHSEVIGGVEICVQMMHVGETDMLKIPARLAYGSKGRDLTVPANADLLCEVELLSIQPGKQPTELSDTERLQLGDGRRLRGNHYYSREEYHQAVPVYQLALEYLDFSTEDSALAKEAEDAQVKIYNNLAATQLKLSAWDAAIISLRDCLRLEPNNPKALFRRAKAELGKREYRVALQTLRQAQLLDPQSTLVTREIHRVKELIAVENKRDQLLYRKMLSGEPTPKAKTWSLRDFIASKVGLISGFTCATAIAMAAFYIRNSSKAQ